MSKAVDGLPTIGAARWALLRRFAAELSIGQRDTAALDARLIFASVLGVDPAELPFRDEQRLGLREEEAIEVLAKRRLAGEPVARILGHREFWGLDFLLSPETLEPRPDTETLVEGALGVVVVADRQRPLRLVDLGTGSGAILLALLSELPNASGIGVDLSPGAIGAARGNAERLGLSERAVFINASWSESLDGPFDLVVSNPPYVESGAIAALEAEVRHFDPALALDGGPDGLLAYRAIIGDLGRILAPDGVSLVEIGAGQAKSVAEIAENHGFSVKFHADLAGHQRVVEMRRKSR